MAHDARIGSGGRGERVILVPGRSAPSAEHWLSRWGREHPEYRWARHREPAGYDLDDRVAALDAAIASASEPVVLVAHSAGCITVAYWAARQHRPAGDGGPVRAALLATPPDLDRRVDTDPGPWIEMPTARLPFRALLVASRNDQMMDFGRAVECARAWGAELVDAGPVGHLDTAAGFGPWPDGKKLLAGLLGA